MPSHYGSPPPSDEEEEESAYIGVPSNYKTRRKVPVGWNSRWFKPTLEREVTPKYKKGDEGRPASWGAERIVELQAQMVDAGVLRPNSYQRGIWDSASKKAYSDLLAMSNQAGLDVNQTLSNYRQVIAKYGSSDEREAGPVKQPLVITRRDPESLRALLGAVSGRIMGGALSREEEDHFIATFNNMSDAAQRAEYEASGAGLPGGPGGTVTDVDPEAQAAKFLREHRPQDVVRHDVIERFDQFQQLLNKYA